MKYCLWGLIIILLTGCTGFRNSRKLNFLYDLNMEAKKYRATLPDNHIPLAVNDKVHDYINKYVKRSRNYFKGILSRAYKYFPMMKKAFQEEGLPVELIYLPIIESEFRVSAYSYAHASGPWQFVKGTGKHYGLKSSWWIDERCSAEKSTIAAARHLKDLYIWLKDWYLALAAYNAGGGKIIKAIRKYETKNFWELTAKKRTFLRKETRYYVPKFLAVVIICENLEKFGFEEIEKEPVIMYDTVEIPDATDLKLIADICEVEYDVIKKLNPELKQWATPPKWENYKLRIPYGMKTKFQIAFNSIPAEERITYRRHKIRKGESVWAIAKKYNVPREMIYEMNKMKKKDFIREGDYLIIPIRGLEKAKEIDKLFSRES